jgi:hypothetical protein
MKDGLGEEDSTESNNQSLQSLPQLSLRQLLLTETTTKAAQRKKIGTIRNPCPLSEKKI